MSVFQRIARYLRARFHHEMDKVENPAVLIDDLVREMKEQQVKNREQAVFALTQKNSLQAEVNKQERMIAEYEKKATIALQSGNRELARQILREKATFDSTLGMLRQSLAAATDSAEKIKLAIKTSEERLRQRMAEAQAMHARLKQAEIQENIHKTLGNFSFNNNQTSWEEVEQRIQQKEARGIAIDELQRINIETKIDEIEMYQKDIGVEQELEELERKLAFGGSPAPTYVPTTNYNVDDAVDSLQQKLGGGSR
jgi:phage shock protein A